MSKKEPAEPKAPAKAWWYLDDPTKSTMYIWFRLLFFIFSLTLLMTVCIHNIAWPGIKDKLPASFPRKEFTAIYGAFFMVWLILYVKAQLIISKRNGKKPDPQTDNEISRKFINRFPGWIMVWLTWFFCWFNLLMFYYSNLWFNYVCSFDLQLWAPVVGVITGVFLLTDSARQNLAQKAESAWKNWLGKFFHSIGDLLNPTSTPSQTDSK